MRGRTPAPSGEAAELQQQAERQVFGYVSERAKRWLDDDLKRTRAGLARKAGLRVDQVHELLNGDRAPTERSMRAIARAVGLDFEELASSAETWVRAAAKAAEPSLPTVAAPAAAAAVARAEPARRRSSSQRAARSAAAPAPLDRYPNRARALQAAALLDHDPRDLQTVLAVVLPPGASDPPPRAWMSWVDRAREERLAAAGPKRPRQRKTP